MLTKRETVTEHFSPDPDKTGPIAFAMILTGVVFGLCAVFPNEAKVVGLTLLEIFR